jgi:hypothetical protein
VQKIDKNPKCTVRKQYKTSYHKLKVVWGKCSQRHGKNNFKTLFPIKMIEILRRGTFWEKKLKFCWQCTAHECFIIASGNWPTHLCVFIFFPQSTVLATEKHCLPLYKNYSHVKSQRSNSTSCCGALQKIKFFFYH